MIFGPSKKYKNGNVEIKNMVSKIAEYKTMVVVFAVGNFSWASTTKDTAEPPTLVGEIAELNSHMNINSKHFRQLNCFSEAKRKDYPKQHMAIPIYLF